MKIFLLESRIEYLAIEKRHSLCEYEGNGKSEKKYVVGAVGLRA